LVWIIFIKMGESQVKKKKKTIDAKDVIQFFLKDNFFFSRHDLPEIIITDNGRQFISDITKTMVESLWFIHAFVL